MKKTDPYQSALDASVAYQKKHFKIKVERTSKRKGGYPSIALRMTHNGHQWGMVLTFLSQDEIDKVIKKLQSIKFPAR